MTEPNDARIRALAERLLTPERRAARPSAVVWDRATTIACAYGPIATWSTGEGPAVILVHGWEADHRDLDAFVEPLVRASRRVVTFDLPAHGDSAGDVATLPDLATALVAVAHDIGPVDAVIAHSVGCAATSLALATERLRARRVAFVAPPLRYEAFVRFFAQQHGVGGDDLVAALAARGLDVAPLDIRANAAALDVPLLIVHARDDRVCDASNATKITAVWQGSIVEFVDGLGHNRILRDDSVVARIMDFVTAPD